MERIKLTSGQTYQTTSGKDAYKVREGSVDVFIVPQEKGYFRRPLHILRAAAGQTIPGMQYTDESYVTWRFQLEAQQDSALQIIDGGNTKPLQRKFIAAAELYEDEELSFEQTMIERYMSDIISEDVFILKSEQARENERKKSMKVLQEAAESSPRQQKTEPKAAIGTGRTAAARQNGRAILRMTGGRWIGSMAAMLLALCAAGIGATYLSGGLFAAGKLLPEIPAAFGLFLVAYLLLRGGLEIRILSAANRIAMQQQRRLYENAFCPDADTAMRGKPRGRAADLLGAAGRTQSMVRNWYGMLAGLIPALGCWIFLMTQYPQGAAAAGLVTAICGCLLYGSRRIAKTNRQAAAASLSEAQTYLRQFLGHMKKVRLCGAMEHVIRRYYAQVADSKASDRGAWYQQLTGQIGIWCVIGVSVILGVSLLGRGTPADPRELAMTAAGSILIILEGCRGARKLADFTISDVWETPQRKDSPQKSTHKISKQHSHAGDCDAGTDAGAEATDLPLLQLRHAGFSYEQRQVLQDISLHIKEGEYLGIAGASGSGKSTLLKILGGVILPEEGQMLYRGEMIMSENAGALRAGAGIVLQNDQLLAGSIRENILAGTEGADRRAFRKAAEMAHLADDAAAMPMGYETLISDQAETVSAGQKQKILLARALVREPALLLLDEAESDLDGKTQRLIRENIRSCVPTGILVSHHFRSLEKCDRIIVLEKGRIVEEGAPEELLEKKQRFFELMKRQL